MGVMARRQTQPTPKMSKGGSFSPGTRKTTLQESYVPPRCLLLHTELRAHVLSSPGRSSRVCFYSSALISPLQSASDCILLCSPCQLGFWPLHCSRCFHGYFTVSVSISPLLWIHVQAGILGPALYHAAGTVGSCVCCRRLDTCFCSRQ